MWQEDQYKSRLLVIWKELHKMKKAMFSIFTSQSNACLQTELNQTTFYYWNWCKITLTNIFTCGCLTISPIEMCTTFVFDNVFLLIDGIFHLWRYILYFSLCEVTNPFSYFSPFRTSSIQFFIPVIQICIFLDLNHFNINTYSNKQSTWSIEVVNPTLMKQEQKKIIRPFF